MESSARQNRLSPAFTGWVIGAMFVGILVLLFWPAPKEPQVPPPPEITRPPSELEKVGLANDPDLEGLPGFFAVWADYAEWKEDKTTFAYRHPVSGEFSLFFEATRTAEGYRFRAVSRPAENQDMTWRKDLGLEVPIQFWITDPSLKELQRIHAEIPHQHLPAKVNREPIPARIQAAPANADPSKIDPPKPTIFERTDGKQ